MYFCCSLHHVIPTLAENFTERAISWRAGPFKTYCMYLRIEQIHFWPAFVSATFTTCKRSDSPNPCRTVFAQPWISVRKSAYVYRCSNCACRIYCKRCPRKMLLCITALLFAHPDYRVRCVCVQNILGRVAKSECLFEATTWVSWSCCCWASPRPARAAESTADGWKGVFRKFTAVVFNGGSFTHLSRSSPNWPDLTGNSAYVDQAWVVYYRMSLVDYLISRLSDDKNWNMFLRHLFSWVA